ncbi:MAG: hypothetical protein H0U53_10930 [Actinobacteria bacterium]|nr:hypothetical protein [Actinomycetota bacterium]
MNLQPKVYDDVWCDLCGEEPTTGRTMDGLGACTGCMLKVLDGIAKQAGVTLVGPNRAQRRAMKKAQRR